MDWARNFGQSTVEIIEKILQNASYPEQAYKTCLGILNLPKGKYSKEDVNLACQRALFYGHSTYKAVNNILQNNLHRQPLDDDQDLFSQLPDHENLRGGNYYHVEETI